MNTNKTVKIVAGIAICSALSSTAVAGTSTESAKNIDLTELTELDLAQKSTESVESNPELNSFELRSDDSELADKGKMRRKREINSFRSWWESLFSDDEEEKKTANADLDDVFDINNDQDDSSVA